MLRRVLEGKVDGCKFSTSNSVCFGISCGVKHVVCDGMWKKAAPRRLVLMSCVMQLPSV